MKKEHCLYFFALVPPEDIQAAVTEIKKDFQDRFEAEHALKSPPHITLIPPFEYLYSEENRLIKNLELFVSKESSFVQKLENFGFFSPKVIYIKVIESEFLLGMYTRFRKFMDSKLGLGNKTYNQRKFKPHMTVAFRDLTRENFYLAESEYVLKTVSFNFLVKGIKLLRHNGRYWDIVYEAQFQT